MIFLKTEKEIETLKEGGSKLAWILKTLKAEAKAGQPLSYLDERAYTLIKEIGAEPAFLNYQPSFALKPFPNSLCVSVNETIVHGIPYKNVFLKNGDVVSLDLGIKYKGLYTDMAITIGIGKIQKEYKKMIKVCQIALKRSIQVAKVNNTLGDIGYEITRIIEGNGFKVIKELVGHGVGYYPHEDPYVCNFGEKGEGEVLKKGMVLAIEPMLTNGSGEIEENPDGSFRTKDKAVAVHFEKTIAVGDKAGMILT